MQWTLLQLLEKFLSVHNKRRTCSQHWPLQTWTSWSNLHNSRIDCNVQRYTLNRRDPGTESRENYIPDNFYFWPQLDPEWKQRPRFILHITQTRRTKLTRVLPWPMPSSWNCWYPIRSRESPGINLMNHRVRKLSSERDFLCILRFLNWDRKTEPIRDATHRNVPRFRTRMWYWFWTRF